MTPIEELEAIFPDNIRNPPVVLEVGKAFVRRDGWGPCYVVSFYHSWGFKVRMPSGAELVYLPNGQYQSSRRIPDYDLVQEWVEVPALVDPFSGPWFKALTAKEPVPEPKKHVLWAVRTSGDFIAWYMSHQASLELTQARCRIRVEFPEGQFDEPQPGDLTTLAYEPRLK